MVKYSHLEGQGWQLLPQFLAKTEDFINIRNDKRCFKYALLYFFERE